MISSIHESRRISMPSWHERFLDMLPIIRQQAWISFRSLKPEAQEDAIQEVVANCLVAFVRLVQLDKVNLAYPTVRHASPSASSDRGAESAIVSEFGMPYRHSQTGKKGLPSSRSTNLIRWKTSGARF